MTLPYLLATLVATPFFATRGFLASFTLAVLARFGPHLPLLRSSATIEVLAGAPSWFTHDLTLLGLGALAALELAAARSATARELFDGVDGFLKAGLQTGVALALVPRDAASLLPHTSAVPWEGLWALALGGGVLVLAQLRQAALRFVRDVDADDSLGLLWLWAWWEDAWVAGGLLFAALAPLAALVLFLVTTGALVLAGRYGQRHGTPARVDCATCGHLLHPCAPSCSACGAARAAQAISVLGTPAARPAGPDHPMALLARHRCPTCAERVSAGACPSCRRGVPSPAEAEALVRYLDRRLPRALGIAFACGLVPVLGIVPAVLFGRLSVTGGLLVWTPLGQRVAVRWLARGATVALVLLQPIPVLGAFAVPAIVLVRYALARRAFARAWPGVAALTG